MSSTLPEALERYLCMRRSCGFKLVSQETRLRGFIAFMEGRNAAAITGALAVEWAGGACGPASWGSRLSTVRSFARYVANIDPQTEIPPLRVFPAQRRPLPYIYSEEEIEILLDVMLALPPEDGLRRWTCHCFFGLLAVTGLRFHEAANLRREEVDLDAGVLTIRDTKFGKSRLVPVHPTTVTVLRAYAERRDADPKRRANSRFLVGERSGGIHYGSIHQAFDAFRRAAGPRRQQGGHQRPRVHDLRHSYAVRTLVRWHRTGEDVERLLPVLSAYLGHTHVRDTYWYLSAVPELLGHAMCRLEARWGEVA